MAKQKKIMVYDLGGGTFDISVIEMGDNLIEVLATAGDNHLGGDDFDARVTEYLIKEFEKQNNIDLNKDPVARQRVKETAEKAKRDLSSMFETNINLPFITMVKGEPYHMDITLTRKQFNELTADLVNRTEGPMRAALEDAGIMPSQLNMVLLVGGSTRIPAVQDKVRAITGREPARNINPDECVALGAAIQGEKLGGEFGLTTGASDIILMDVTPRRRCNEDHRKKQHDPDSSQPDIYNGSEFPDGCRNKYTSGRAPFCKRQ